MRKLIIILLFPISLFGQVTSLPMMSDYSTPISSGVDGFDIFNTWDFETEDVGWWEDNDIQSYFTPYDETRDNLHNTDTHSWFIVTDTINETKNLQRYHWYDADHPSTQIAPEIHAGWGSTHEEIYVSYDYQQGVNWSAQDGGKIPGMYCTDRVYPREMEPGEGWINKLNFKEGGTFNLYMYDHTYSWNPWAEGGGTTNQDTFQFVPGTTYRVTQRTVLNSYSGSWLYDGLIEIWVDGNLKYQATGLRTREDSGTDFEIQWFGLATFYGPGSGSAEHDCYNYFDNITIWNPASSYWDDTFGTHDAHDVGDSLVVPYPIQNEEFHYDYLITDDNDDLDDPGNPYPASTNTTWLIRAPEDYHVQVVFSSGTLGSDNYLMFYNGKFTSNKTLDMAKGYQSNLGSSIGTVTSTGREMLVSLVSQNGGASGNFSGNITFIAD